MEKITKHELVLSAPRRFRKFHLAQSVEDARQQHDEKTEGLAIGSFVNFDPGTTVLPELIHQKVAEMESLGDSITEADVIRITGEKRWTELVCDETGKPCDAVVVLADRTQLSKEALTNALALL